MRASPPLPVFCGLVHFRIRPSAMYKRRGATYLTSTYGPQPWVSKMGSQGRRLELVLLNRIPLTGPGIFREVLPPLTHVRNHVASSKKGRHREIHEGFKSIPKVHTVLTRIPKILHNSNCRYQNWGGLRPPPLWSTFGIRLSTVCTLGILGALVF